jgi:NADPH-dependent curcumin reductase CurA
MAADLRGSLADACPQGIDVYFDNVGGVITDAAISLLALRARVVICGQISQYNLTKPARGPRNLTAFLTNRASLQGILVSDWSDRYDEGLRQLAAWVREGRLRPLETVVEGLENAPAAFIGLFHGNNVGKMLVRVADERA